MHLLLLPLLLAAIASGGGGVDIATPGAGGVTEEQAAAAFGVDKANLVELDPLCCTADFFEIELSLGKSGSLILDCTKFSVRSDDFTLIGERPDGSWGTIDPGPVRTFFGEVRGEPGTVVTGIVREGVGLTAMIQFADDRTLEVRPASTMMGDVQPGLHVVYDSAGLRLPPATCGSDEVLVADGAAALQAACVSDGPFSVRMVADTDSTFLDSFPGTRAEQESAALDYIELDVLNLNVHFGRDLNTQHQLVQVVLRTAANDIYASPNPVLLLGNGIDYWLAHQPPSGPAHIAAIWVNHTLGGPVGVAFLASNCGPGPCVVQRFGGVVTRAVLLAHEVGHVWGAAHCNTSASCGNSCTGGTIMNSIINTADPRFAPCSIQQISAARSDFTCSPDPQLVRPSLNVVGGGPVQNGSTVQLGTVAIGSTVTKTFRVTNPNSCDIGVQVAWGLIGGVNGIQLISGGGDAVLLPGGTRDVVFQYQPFATGHHEASLLVKFPGAAVGGSYSVRLAGDAIASPPAAPALQCPLNEASARQPNVTSFTWSAAANATHYVFMIAKDRDFLSVIYQSPQLTGLSHTPTISFSPNSAQVWWKVRAVNASGTTDSAVRTVYCQEAPFPIPKFTLLLNGERMELSDMLQVRPGKSMHVEIENLWPNALTVYFTLPSFLSGQTTVTIPQCGKAEFDWQWRTVPPPYACETLFGSADWSGVEVRIAQIPYQVEICPDNRPIGR
jgi:hypothetical protein